jgi:pyruvate kinase
MKKTKIICTIGPSTSSGKTLASLIKAGMDVARLNFSHGTHDEHSQYIRHIRKLSLELNKPVMILQDLQGIKIRIGKVAGESIRIKKSQKIELKPGKGTSTGDTLFVSYDALLKDLKKGQRILLDDGLIQLRVTEKIEGSVIATVKEGGILTANKGVNLPDTAISLKPFTDKDRDDLAFGIKNGVDAVALSFVLDPGDIRMVKEWLNNNNSTIPVIAKIEKPEALFHIDEIIKASDGIMVARGGLGVEVPQDEIPVIQKHLIRKANELRKPVITATQMLESMREHIRPTRAEITDVANAVIDGSDALMLSAETSTGKYPVQAARLMKKIIRTTEKKIASSIVSPALFNRTSEDRLSNAVADAAVRAADDMDAKCITAFTRSGFTALLLSKFRPSAPIIAFTPDEAVMREMSLYWGVRPHFMKLLKNTDEMVYEVEKALIGLKLAQESDLIVITASSPLRIQLDPVEIETGSNIVDAKAGPRSCPCKSRLLSRGSRLNQGSCYDTIAITTW